MARGGAEWVRGVKWFSYKRIFIGVCCVNVFLSVLLLRSLYSSYFASSLSSTEHDGVFSEEQIKRVEESIRIRQALEPVELVRLAKKVKKELKSGKKGFKLSKSVNQKLALEILARLKGLGSSVNLTEQREVVELWRVEKMDEIKRLLVANSTKDSIPSKATSMNEKKLKIVLELHWQKFLEGIGFWVPSYVTNSFLDDMPDTADELEEEIIPGRSMPPACHTELHTDYAGAAVRWGLTHHKESAADCCQACLDQAKSAKPGEMKCNIWVYCPSEYGCYSPDIYEHKHQECWLKQDEKPRLSFKHKYSESYRNSHPTAPVAVPWMSGVISR